MRKILILAILALSYSSLIAQKKTNPKVSIIDHTSRIDVNNLDFKGSNIGLLNHSLWYGIIQKQQKETDF